MDNISTLNKTAWDRKVEKDRDCALPVTIKEIEQARKGKLDITLTGKRLVPREWFKDVNDKKHPIDNHMPVFIVTRAIKSHQEKK